MIKRIYAIVTDKEFYLFRKAAFAGNNSIGDAVTKLIIAYGKGEIELPEKRKKKEKKEKPTNEYLDNLMRRN